MMDFNYTVKVYCDAIEDGFRTVESISQEFQKAVEKELSERQWRKAQHE